MTVAEDKRAAFAANYVSAFCKTDAHFACKGSWPAYGLTPALVCRCVHHVEPTEPVRVVNPSWPGAEVAFDGEVHSEGWHAYRRAGLTATDIVKIATGTYGGGLAVYRDKLGISDGFEGNGATRLGTDLEEPIAQIFARDFDCRLEEVPGLRSTTYPWALASLDRLAYRDDWDEPRIVEVKSKSLRTGTWDDGIVPNEVLYQVQWQLMVSGLHRAYVALAVTGKGFSAHFVKRDDDMIAMLIEKARYIWDCVQARVEPTFDEMPRDAETVLNQLHPDRAGAVELDFAGQELLDEYRQVSFDCARIYRRKDELRAHLIQRLGDANGATVGGQDAFSYVTTEPERFDTKRFRKDHPELAAHYVSKAAKPTHTLKLAKSVEQRNDDWKDLT